MDDAGHLADRVDPVLHPGDVGRAADDVHGELDDARVLGQDVGGAVRLRHDAEVGPDPAPQEVHGPDSALELPDHAGD